MNQAFSKKLFSRLLLLLLFAQNAMALTTQASTSHPLLAVVEQTAGKVGFYDARSHQRVGETSVGLLPHEIALSPDGNTAYVSNFGLQDYDENIGIPGDTISVINTHTFQEIARLSTGFQNAPHGVKIRPNHPDELYVNTEIDGKILVFDVRTKSIKKVFSATQGTHNFIFSADGAILWLMAGSHGVTKLDAEQGTVLGNYYAASPIRGIQYTPDGHSIMVSSTNQISFFDPDTLNTTRSLDNLGVDQILYSAISRNGRFIVAPAVWNNQILIINNQTGAVVKRLVTGLDPVNVVIDDESHYAYVSNARNSHISKINLDTLHAEEIHTQAGPNGIALLDNTFSVHSKKQTLPQLTLGAFIPLTGENKGLGRDEMLGYEFWRDAVNQQGGLKIGSKLYEVKIAYKDTQSQDDSIGALVKELNSEYSLNGLLGTQDENLNKKLRAIHVPLYPFMAELDDYDGLDKGLFLPYINQQELFNAYQNALNLTMTKPAERAYLSVKLIQRTLSEHLYLPEGITQAPALVLLHASSGIQDTDKNWAKLLQAQGYAVLLVDSFTARGYVDRKAIGWNKAYQAQLNDLPDAYLLMSQQKTVNPERVGLIGFSLGGYSVLRAMQHDEMTKIPFKSAASFYGHAQRFNPGSQFDGQVALFQGDDDDRSPLSGAITLKDTAHNSVISLYRYPKALHGFDNAYLPKSLELTDENGMTYHLGYNKDAHEHSINDLLSFLKAL